MNFQIPIQLESLEPPISYPGNILLTGSCFTEHIGDHLQELKFKTLQNPNGILFDPSSVASSLVSYVENKRFRETDLVFLNELWQSWQHHSVYSHVDKEACLEHINASQERAHIFLKNARWLIITLGTSFSYRLAENNRPVANCHRAPAGVFRKHLMTIEEINTAFDTCIHRLAGFNPGLRILFTISPVRHIRDGVVENNRSKARLIEVVHHLANKFSNIHYFPAYELLIDVLRDYRFYDADMVHPNYQATSYVLEKFSEYCIDTDSNHIMREVRQIVIAAKHKPFQPLTDAHRKFMRVHFEKASALQAKYPFLDLEKEMAYFANGMG